MVTIQKIRAAIKTAYDKGHAKLKGTGKSVPKLEDFRIPLRDGDKDRRTIRYTRNSRHSRCCLPGSP